MIGWRREGPPPPLMNGLRLVAAALCVSAAAAQVAPAPVLVYPLSASSGLDNFSATVGANGLPGAFTWVPDRNGCAQNALQFNNSYITSRSVPSALPVGSAQRSVAAWVSCRNQSRPLATAWGATASTIVSWGTQAVNKRASLMGFMATGTGGFGCEWRRRGQLSSPSPGDPCARRRRPYWQSPPRMLSSLPRRFILERYCVKRPGRLRRGVAPRGRLLEHLSRAALPERLARARRALCRREYDGYTAVHRFQLPDDAPARRALRCE